MVVATTLAVADSKLAAFDLVATDLGAPRISSFVTRPVTPPGWTAQGSTSFEWAKPFFGGDSTWNRFEFGQAGGAPWPTLTLDDVVTPSLYRLETYGVEACYGFHGDAVTDLFHPGLGGGVVGLALSYRTDGQGDAWNVVSWVWRVTTAHGNRYERITLTGRVPAAQRRAGELTMEAVAHRVIAAIAVAGSPPLPPHSS